MFLLPDSPACQCGKTQTPSCLWQRADGSLPGNNFLGRNLPASGMVYGALTTPEPRETPPRFGSPSPFAPPNFPALGFSGAVGRALASASHQPERCSAAATAESAGTSQVGSLPSVDTESATKSR